MPPDICVIYRPWQKSLKLCWCCPWHNHFPLLPSQFSEFPPAEEGSGTSLHHSLTFSNGCDGIVKTIILQRKKHPQVERRPYDVSLKNWGLGFGKLGRTCPAWGGLTSWSCRQSSMSSWSSLCTGWLCGEGWDLVTWALTFSWVFKHAMEKEKQQQEVTLFQGKMHFLQADAGPSADTSVSCMLWVPLFD